MVVAHRSSQRAQILFNWFRMDAAENGEEDQLNSKKAVTLVML
jgi:hypothetical protein